jgi:double-strand break repair protein MRE11
VALIEVHGKEYNLRAIPLRTVRPFVLEEISLAEVAEEEGFDTDDQMEIAKWLKAKVCIYGFLRSGPLNMICTIRLIL